MAFNFLHWYSLKSLGCTFHWSLFLLFLYLRLKGDKEPLTLSQRWALTILMWLFLLNSITITAEYWIDTYLQTGYVETSVYLRHITGDLDVLIGMTLLSFGLVYPRPFTEWKRLQLVLLGIIFLTFILLGLRTMANNPENTDFQWSANVSNLAYLMGWFIPVLIWLPMYETETSPQSKMVLTLLIWGFIGSAMTHIFNGLIQIISTSDTFGFNSLLSIVLITYVTIKLVLIMWKKRNGWESTDSIHLGFLAFTYITSLLGQADLGPSFTFFIIHISHNWTWTILRPALFSYAILRFQMFGPRLRVDRPLTYIIAIMSCLFILNMVQLIPLGLSDDVMFIVGAVVAFLLSIPILKWSKGLVRRYLPMTGGEGTVTMREKRAIYLIGLQTAVVKGRIDMAYDEDVLEEQRRALAISRREHDLLVDSLAMREGIDRRREVIDELFLVNIDGRLMVHVSRKKPFGERTKGGEKDMDIVAGMLAAIRDFVKEGLRTGARSSLDSIRYGIYSLVIEAQGRLVLAAVVEGPGSPELRQHLGDQLALIRKRHGNKLDKWDGDKDDTVGAQHILEGFMEEVQLL